MKIYKVYRTDTVDYDEYDGAVIVAKNENHAREIDSSTLDDGSTQWLSDEHVKVEIVSNKDAGIILSSFNAG